MSKKVKIVSIVPAATEAAIQPKPTKSEIVEALTRLKVEELEAQNEVALAAREAQKTAIQILALQELLQELSTYLASAKTHRLGGLGAKKSPFIAEKGDVRVNRDNSYVEFSVRVSENPDKSEYYGSDAVAIQASKVLASQFRKLEALPSTKWVREDEIRKEIKESLSRDSAGRVSRLLADVESRAALSELLKVVESGVEKRLN